MGTLVPWKFLWEVFQVFEASVSRKSKDDDNLFQYIIALNHSLLENKNTVLTFRYIEFKRS